MHSQSTFKLPITIDSLANHSDKLVNVEAKHTHLKGYEYLRECKCFRVMNRTETELNGYGKDIVNVPRGFKNPLDFFESVISKYCSEQFYNSNEIHIMSFGSGDLLHEAILIAKLIKELDNKTGSIPKIILHAVDINYKKPDRISDQAWEKSRSYLCQQQFNQLITELKINVVLKTYSSLGEYEKERDNISPTIILVIDVPFRFAPDFPLPNPKQYSTTSLELTQKGILQKTKESATEGSLVVSLTHIEANRGLFIVLEEKEKKEWKTSWIHTIASTKKINFPPPSIIEFELSQKANEYFSSELGKYELSQMKRFEKAPLSQAVMDIETLMEFRNNGGTIISKLLNSDTTDINAQCTEGFTALHWAAMRKDENLIKILVTRGADINIKNKYGRTAFDYYIHQPSPDDFRESIDKELYNKLSAQYHGTPTEVMPEFNEAYFAPEWKPVALQTRTPKPEIKKLLSGNKEKNETKEWSLPKEVLDHHILKPLLPQFFLPK